MNADTLKKFQRHILDHCRRVYFRTPLSEATERAYLATPRHLFVRRYRVPGQPQWHDVTPDNQAQHFPSLYADHPLVLVGEEGGDVPSTISQPSFVLRMLDLLQLQPGLSVFELGAGSGWNAAMLGRLVGPTGKVFSLEIIPEVAQAAAAAVQSAGITNVSIISADGGDGYPAGAPYDRAIFTAGAYDLPRAFHDQLREGGLLLAVIKLEGGGDSLFLLRKINDHFESVDSMSCAFVQLRGKHELAGLEPTSLNALPEWPELQNQEVSRTRFWWAGKGSESFVWRTASIRFFLSISEPRFRVFKIEKTAGQPRDEHCFGLWDPAQKSLVLAKDDSLIAYGDISAREHLLAAIRRWVELGMPSAASFKLQVYLHGDPVTAGKNQWLVKRGESTFLWSLEHASENAAQSEKK